MSNGSRNSFPDSTFGELRILREDPRASGSIAAGASLPFHASGAAVFPIALAATAVSILSRIRGREEGVSRESVFDEGCCFWIAEAAGELPHGLTAGRHFLPAGEAGENHDMKKKAASIQITRFDKTRLMRLLHSLDPAAGNRVEIEDLERELERGAEVESTEVAPDVVTMNSTVRVTDLDASATQFYTIVFPGDADFEKGRISILSHLGTALLGCRAGDVITLELPRGTRRLRIEELIYQPEAAGDFHL
jgi:regulator of nucleoside diphosphate kinase